MRISAEESDIIDVRGILNDYFGLGLTSEQVGEFLQRNPSVCAEIAKFGAFDTETRSAIADTLCDELGVGDWPTYGMGQEVYEKFKLKLADAAKIKGYAFNPED
jgi:hypothetical protein